MSKLLKVLLIGALSFGGVSITASAALAGGGGGGGGNDADGDIASETDQSGGSASGDSVAGQVVGVVSAGDASVDSTNRSEDVDVESGDANGINSNESDTGQLNFGGAGSNDLEDGEISSDLVQASESSTGDAVGGAVIGVVTSAGGSADVVAANTSEEVDVETGDSFGDNFAVLFAAQDQEGGGENEMDGDIGISLDQAVTAASGDGVGGQVLGVVSAGDTSIDATNESTDVDVETGLASGDNFGALDAAQANFGSTGNNMEGDIEADVTQSSDATSGDGVGGQVIGAVTSAGGSADVVAANTSEEVDVETGDSFAFNSTSITTDIGQINVGRGPNNMVGDIAFDAGQSVTAASGDGVGGQVLGIVSAGDASVDATSESTDVDVETGEAFADNFIDTFVGQFKLGDGINEMEGDIDSEVAQDASAASGDAVAGQVAGVVTSTGGSADLVLANTSENVDGETGDSDFFNELVEFVGQQIE